MQPLSPVLGGGALGNLVAILIGRRGSYARDLGAAIVSGAGRRCLRQLSGRTYRAARAPAIRRVFIMSLANHK